MGDGYWVSDMGELRRYHQWMNTVDDAYRDVNTYVQAEVCNKSGFTGVLTRLGDAMDYISDGYSSLTFFTIDKLEATEEAFFDAARTYSKAEGEAQKYFAKSDQEVEQEIQQQANENRLRKLMDEGVL